ncbi:hypothetical protein VNO77_32963 [Canavalia gladiata]|uniref:Uncharacterized protein n=1 Tax=Canavalia gladiata TaxID=3824 RepID=A0AAN9KEQ6_CANGL
MCNRAGHIFLICIYIQDTRGLNFVLIPCSFTLKNIGGCIFELKVSLSFELLASSVVWLIDRMRIILPAMEKQVDILT